MKKLVFNLMAFALVGLFAFTIINPTDDGYGIGDIAMDFSLKNVDGNMVSMSDFSNAKGFIVIFTCNECPYAKLYEDRINDLNKKYAPKGYPVIAINPNDPVIAPGDSFEKMKIRANEKDFSFPYLVDETQEIASTYGATKTPHVYILNAKKVVKYIGTIDNNPRNAASADVNYVENAIEAIESKRKPNPATTKAIGCGIKYRKAG